MQNYERLYWYIHDYQDLIYRYYSKHAIAYLTTYYNLDSQETIWDNIDLMGGAYERIGDLTGIKWNKILLYPVFFIEEVSTAFDGSETGYIKEGETSFVFPSSYGVTPYPGDIIKMEQSYLRKTNDVYPIYIVSGVEKSVNTDLTFWKVKVVIEQSRTVTEVDNQISDTYVFYDYTKKIHEFNNAEFLTRMLLKKETLRGNLNDLFDSNSGLFLL